MIAPWSLERIMAWTGAELCGWVRSEGKGTEGWRDKRSDVAWGGGDWIASGICDAALPPLLSHRCRNRRFTPYQATSPTLALS